jgi:hypothetical protein
MGKGRKRHGLYTLALFSLVKLVKGLKLALEHFCSMGLKGLLHLAKAHLASIGLLFLNSSGLLFSFKAFFLFAKLFLLGL